MDKIVFQAPQNGESIEFYVVEQTRINGTNYLLVTEEEEGDCDAYILKEVSQEENDDITYELVESEEELEYMSRIFGEILEEVDLTM
ncbi:hypothetical protein C806_02513 [Lachnospiraceae bacterium 3-1]|nr:hypothetical protein C806_02513 [Lachnospiraceae bacterium 3-1]